MGQCEPPERALPASSFVVSRKRRKNERLRSSRRETSTLDLSLPTNPQICLPLPSLLDLDIPGRSSVS